MSHDDSIPLRLGHSPDPDDAFMWYPLANFPAGSGPGGQSFTPCFDTSPYRFVHVLEDIQSLNLRSEKGELEITALSIHQYPFVADRYVLTSCGSSMGENYGPMVVAQAERKLTLQDLKRVTIAVPGLRTTAFLVLSLLLREQGLGDFRYEVVPFDQIQPRVRAGEFEAGLIIHEGQLTYAKQGLVCLADLGTWWMTTQKLPLPLGGNAIRRDLGQHVQPVCDLLLKSIRYALDHRPQAVAFALNYARDMTSELADQFVGMYVNHWTLDYGPMGQQAVERLLTLGAQAGLTPPLGKLEVVQAR